MKRKSIQFRRSVLAAACVLTVGAASAQAGDYYGPGGNYTLSFGEGASSQLSLRDYILAITAPQQNPELVSALIEAASAGSQLEGSGASHPVTVGSNKLAATATGNSNSSTADLALLSAGAEGQNGLGIATSQLRGGNYYGTQTQASVDESRIAVDSYGITPAAVSVAGNAISAAAVLNQSSSTASGVVPAGYGASQAADTISPLSYRPAGAMADVSTSRDGMNASTLASIDVATYQAADQAGMDAGSSASVSYSTIGLSQQGGGTAEQPLSLANNSVAASYVANNASGVVQATGGSAFQASALVTNAQVNGEGRTLDPVLPLPPTDGGTILPDALPLSMGALYYEGPSATALVQDSRITADLGGYEDKDGATRLNGALSLTGNTISAASTGNAAGARATDGTIAAGNAIVVNASTVGGAYGFGGAQVSGDGSYSGVQLYADLGVLNTQTSRSTTLSSSVVDSGVAVRADRLQSQAAIAVSGNSLTADATGNLAGNLVDVQATNFGATVAAANVQGNEDTSISSSLEGAQVTVEGGGSGRNVRVQGSTTLANNTIAATAAGNIAATNVSVQAGTVQSADAESGSAQAMAQAWDGTYASARGGVTATNVQTNTGSDSSIDASVYGGTVGADLTGSGYGSGSRPRLDGATVSLTGNTLSAQATGNGAATGISLSGTNGLAQAAVANAQSNDVRISAATIDTGVAAMTGAAGGSTITVQGNTVSAAATANQASNKLSSTFTNLDVSSASSYYGIDSVDSIDGPGYYAVPAVQAIASAQSNSASVRAENSSESGFATATLTGSRRDSGASDTSITVQGNQASASANGNQVSNALAIDAGTMTRQYGSGTSIAVVSNTQGNDGSVRSSVSGYDHQLSIGTNVQGTLDGANVAVTGNSAVATALANDASNKLTVTGGSLGQTDSYALYDLAPSYGGPDFALANQQGAEGKVQAKVSDVRIGVEQSGERNDWVGGSTIAVNGNTIAAEARANNAVNAASLTGFSTLASNAIVSNTQYGESSVSSRVDDAQLRVGSKGNDIEASQLSINDNTVQSLAVGASATNSLAVQATNLQGSTPVYAPVGVTMTMASMDSDMPSAGYAVNNSQYQTGSVRAQTEASVRMNLDGSGLEGSSATVSGNAISAVAQATSASNSLSLSGTTIGSTGGTVNSSQTTSANVSAEQAAPRNGSTLAVQAGGAYAAPLTVSNNSVLVSAGQNEAFNSVGASGATVAGQYAVLNSQQGDGSVTARAQPGLVGISASAAYGSNLTVSGNSVAAQAAFNNASNSLSIDATAANATAGIVRNDQSTGSGMATATVGGYDSTGAVIGVTQGLYGDERGTSLTSGAATVNGNSISAAASGNTVANTLAVSAPASAGYSYGAGYQVLNTQTNQASLASTITGSGLLVNNYGGSLQGSTVAVTGNTLAATATGNSASNSLSLTAAQVGLGQGAAISNVQYNNASITAAVRGAMVGTAAGSVSGGSTAVTGNSISAQAVGNSAVNKLVAK